MKKCLSPGLVLGFVFLFIAGGCADQPLPIPPGTDLADSAPGSNGTDGSSNGSAAGSTSGMNGGSGGIQEGSMASSGEGTQSGGLGSFLNDPLSGGDASGDGKQSGGMGDFLTGPLTGEGSPSGGLGGAGSGTVASMVPFHTTPNLSDVFFAHDKHDLTEQSKTVLRNNAEWLKSNPDVRVQVQGHCDERGTNNYNLALGQRRAQSTKNYLVSLGVSKKRINAMTYGEEKPFCVASNEGCWSQNRRGHFMVSR